MYYKLLLTLKTVLSFLNRTNWLSLISLYNRFYITSNRGKFNEKTLLILMLSNFSRLLQHLLWHFFLSLVSFLSSVFFLSVFYIHIFGIVFIIFPSFAMSFCCQTIHQAGIADFSTFYNWKKLKKRVTQSKVHLVLTMKYFDSF